MGDLMIPVQKIAPVGWLEKVPFKHILPNGGEKMVMNPMVQSAKKHLKKSKINPSRIRIPWDQYVGK